MLGQLIRLRKPAHRIVSLVPSQTELLFDLGLEDQVIGITKFCIHPSTWLQSKKNVGGTKNIHIDAIRELQPDLIIANKEENVEKDILELQKYFPVWISDVNTLSEALIMIREIGILCNRAETAENLIAEIKNQFSSINNSSRFTGKKAVYYIWKNPWLTAGHHTFIDAMISACGLHNASTNNRYPEISPKELAKLDIDYVFLSSEPYPFKEDEKEHLSSYIDSKKIIFVDGTYFSWYGSRLKPAPTYFKSPIYS